MADTGSGHNVRSTVFIECRSMYRKDGPEEMRPVGEVEYVQGQAAASASGLYGPTPRRRGHHRAREPEPGRARRARAGSPAGREPEPLSRHPAFSDVGPASRGREHRAAQERGPACERSVPRRRARAGAHGIHARGMVLPPAAPGDGRVRESGARAHDRAEPRRRAAARRALTRTATTKSWTTWRKGIAAVAACPNVVVKLGGLGMVRCGFDWHTREKPIGSEELAAGMAPFLDYCIEKFTPARCMFESNFPVDKVSFSYNVMCNAFKRHVQRLFGDASARRCSTTRRRRSIASRRSYVFRRGNSRSAFPRSIAIFSDALSGPFARSLLTFLPSQNG